MDRKIIATAAFFGMTAVILGALGAHKLKELLPPNLLASFETGVRFQTYHAFLLLFVGGFASMTQRAKSTVFWLTVVGILFFSGSIYLLSTSPISGLDFRSIGWITPIGGLLLIAAWGVIAANFIAKKS